MTTEETASASSPALPPPPQLNFDCLEVVLRYVNDYRTLYTFLTLSKDVFRIAVKRLYALLFTFENQSKQSVERCLHFIASISPCKNDTMVQALENAFGPTERTIAPGTQPYADYLSFVRDLSFVLPSVDIILQMPPSYETLKLVETSKLQGPIAWAIGGHRLSEIEVLSLNGGNDIRFGNRAKQLTALKRIVVYPSPMVSWQSVHTFVRRYVAAHGDAGRRVVLDVRDNRVLPCQMAMTYALLCPPHGGAAPYHLNTSNLAPYAGHMDTVDFGAVKRVDISLTNKNDHQQQQGGASYAWASNILDWSVIVPAPLLPLKTLHIRRLDNRGQAFVNAALERFASTLETINIDTVNGQEHYPHYYSAITHYHGQHTVARPYRIANIPGLEFPNLRRFSANVYYPLDIALDPRCLPAMPRLEELCLVQDDTRSHDSRERRTNSTTLPSDLTSWPSEYQLPNLRHLRMMGRPMLEFHPACLRSMPLLEELALGWVPKWTEENNEGQAAANWPNQELWTWDDGNEGWEFPALKSFKVSDSMLPIFKWSVLRGMSKLTELILTRDRSIRSLMALLDDLDRGNDDNENSHSSNNGTTFIHPSLETLTITVGGRLSIDQWNNLLGPNTTGFNFPGLKKLNLYSFQGRFHNAVIPSIAGRHPALEDLEIRRSSSFFSPKKLYWDEDNDYRPASGSYGNNRTGYSNDSRDSIYTHHQASRDDRETMQREGVDESVIRSLPRVDVLAVRLDFNRFWVLKAGKRV
ncbi:hypothetical protein BGZ97_000503 [Linnemannia gamsii]|uniref:Uncharacterized protein n=1 Tax=Linnemannia gamsii TaxID=64522 RepID=A0A9P6UJZ2_9FUNG|nr:hypothetical protein BGZ97_000503 [Linnemannia gamsii]